MSAPPPWRAFAADSVAARLGALAACAAALALAGVLIGAPLMSRWSDAAAKAARLDGRAAALTAAADARRAEAAGASSDPAAIAAAEAWLARFAPVRTSEAAMLDLLSAIRLLAETADVELLSAAPLAQGRSGGGERLFSAADMAGLEAVAAEARLATDHQGLARFLKALEAAEPALRAAAFEATARSSAAPAEDRRLTVRITIGALSRPGGA